MRSSIMRSTRWLQPRSTSTISAPSRPHELPRAACIFCHHRQLAAPPPRPTTTTTPRRPNSTSTQTRTPNATPSSHKKDPPHPRTHYDLFPATLPHGPPPTGPFTIPLRALRAEYLRLQSTAHPDLHSGPEKARAEALSAHINEAYKTLQDPLRRAEYLLSLRGMEVGEDERAGTEDAEVLMAVMEAREAIEGAEAEGELVGVREENEGRIEASLGALEEAFMGGEWGAARREAVRLRYWVNVRESLDAWEKGGKVVLVH
jgi:molecular chaperone HscB